MIGTGRTTATPSQGEQSEAGRLGIPCPVRARLNLTPRVKEIRECFAQDDAHQSGRWLERLPDY